ncbi:MAG: hypothetical protein ACRDZ7_17960 [Acidimicrobiia bacterium]
MVACALLVLAGVAAVVRWSHLPFQALSQSAPATAGQRYLWNVTVAVTAGLAAGVLVAGAGGRLAMRVLAVTAGDGAQGKITEASEVVGRITVDGTIGFLMFTGLFFGLASGVLYALLRRWLPPGRLGGLAFGALLLVVAGTRLEPLRADNPDFDLVGPSWLALTLFAALALIHGLVLAAVAARVSRTLPLFSIRSRRGLGYAPLLALLPIFPVYLVMAVAGVLTVAVSRMGPGPRTGIGVPAGGSGEPGLDRATLIAGRAVLIGIVLVALPGFVSTVADIAGRGP